MSKKRDKAAQLARNKRRSAMRRSKRSRPKRKNDAGAKGRSGARDSSKATVRDAPALPAFSRSAAELTGDIRTIAGDLVKSMAAHDAFDVVATLSFIHFVQNPDDYREAEQTPAANIEYAVELARKRTDRRGTNARREPIDGPTLESWNRDLGRVVMFSLLAASRSRPRGDNDAMEALRYAITSQDFFVRARAYDHQERALIKNLFGSPTVDAALKTQLGFGAIDALSVFEVMSSLVTERWNDQYAEARSMRDRLLREYESARKGAAERSEFRDALDAMLEMPAKKAQAFAELFCLQWIWTAIGDHIQCTAAELAARTPVAEDVVRRVLDTFSLTFEASLELDVATPTAPARDRPILADAEGHYLLVVGQNFLWALRRKFERVLKPAQSGQEIWQAYSTHRSGYVEHRGVDLLRRTLRPLTALENVKYSSGGKPGELDGLIVLDSAVIVVEAKSGGLRGTSWRAEEEPLVDDLKQLVGKAAEQTQRFQEAVRRRQPLTLRDADGNHVGTLNCAHVRQIFALAVTLEDLNWVSPTAWELFDAGIVGSAEPPYIVNLADLEVICEIIEFPCQLIHYLQRRTQLNAIRRIHAADELDFFMHYLQFGLLFDRELEQLAATITDPTAPASIHIGTLTDELDAYYFWRVGVRNTPAPRPVQPICTELHEMLEDLDQKRPAEFLAASLLLLDMGGDLRQRFCAEFGRMRRQASDGRGHDITLGFGDSGITLMTAPKDQFESLDTRLQVYAVLKKYQMRAARWLALGIVDGAPGIIQSYLFGQGPWVPDPKLDEGLARLNMAPSAPVNGSK